MNFRIKIEYLEVESTINNDIKPIVRGIQKCKRRECR